MNRNRTARFWASVHYLLFLTAATSVALLTVKMLAMALAVLFLRPVS